MAGSLIHRGPVSPQGGTGGLPELASTPAAGRFPRAVAGAFASLAVLILFLGCAGTPNYTTAKKTPKGQLQVGPHITSFTTLAPDRYGDVISPHYYSLGGIAEYGLTHEVNIIAGIQRAALAEYGDEFLYNLDVKYGGDGITEAMSVGYGFFPAIGLHQANFAAYTNWYYNRRIYYCLSPNLSLLLFSSKGDGGGVIAMNGVVNNSMTFEFLDRFFIRPQAGVNVLALWVKMAIFNYGVAAGLAF